MRLLLIAALLTLAPGKYLKAQALHLVYFQQKNAAQAVELSPETFARRQALGLPLQDSLDLPVDEGYVREVEAIAGPVRYRLRWLNAVSLRLQPAQAQALRALPFVAAVAPMGGELRPAKFAKKRPAQRNLDTLRHAMRYHMNLDSLAAHGLDGSGLRIAVLDVGFKGADKHPAFEQLRKEGRILAARDFYSGRPDPYRHDEHGTMVLSCMAGVYKGKALGAANGASFILARTEHRRSEKAIEEDHWIAALEWAESLGAQIVNSSLGYSRPRYSNADMDGRSAPVSRAAALALQKGMLVVVAAGNEGDEKWHYLNAPADAPEALAVGGTFPFIRHRIKFSSFGPNADSVLKPNVCAPAYCLAANGRGGYSPAPGTSFAAPLVSGFAACVWQKYPELKAYQVFMMMQQLGHLYPYYDYAHGYGVPDAAKLFSQADSGKTAFSVQIGADSVRLRFEPSTSPESPMAQYGRMLYYHFERPTGRLAAYSYEMIPTDKTEHHFALRRFGPGTLRIWFDGALFEQAYD